MKYLAALALLIIIAIGFGAATNSLPVRIHEFINLNHGDKILHFLLIGGANGLAILLIDTKIKMHPKLIAAITAIVLTLSTMEEFTQKLFPYRTFSLKDLVANYTGIIFFGLIALFLVKMRNRKAVTQEMSKTKKDKSV